jgi:MYXO-CTERM domain-containing protein
LRQAAKATSIMTSQPITTPRSGAAWRNPRAFLLSASLGAAALCISGHASAFSIETSVTAGCHESITASALRGVRAIVPNAPPIAPDDDELALIDDLPFTLDDDLRDIGSASLLIGARDNDIKGYGVISIDEISQVQGDPLTQHEHCLRSAGEDEPGGTQSALLDCKQFIRDRVLRAMDGLDAAGAPDPRRRLSIPLVLSVRGLVSASLPVFYVRMGQALHALEDGFAHTLRTSDGMRVTSALNYIDLANATLNEPIDGPPHEAQLDRCDDPDEIRARNHHLAIAASTDMLQAALDPSLDRGQKERAVDEVLNRYLSFEPGCTFTNGWCNAPEIALPAAGCGCVVAGASGGPSSLGLGLVALMLAVLRRSAKRGRRVRAGALASALAFAALVAASPSNALAAPTDPAAAAPTIAAAAAPTALTPAEVKANARVDAPIAPAPKVGETPRVVARLVTKDEATKERAERDRSRFSLFFAASGAIDKPAIAGDLAVRWQLNESWVIGLDAEFNPYYGIQSKTFRMGSFNGYATLIRRYPMRFESVNLRTSAHLGTSVLLMDLYGAPRGSTGIFLGISPLGVEWKISRAVYIVVDPINIAVAAPQLAATPFVYQQYRFTIGVELAPW